MPSDTFVAPQVPDKLYFKIGEVSSLTGLPTHVLRFWEGEFSVIQPKRTTSGQRLYRQQDVLTIFRIRHLLHERKFTIEGARQHLKALRRQSRQDGADPLDEIRAELEAIRDLLY